MARTASIAHKMTKEPDLAARHLAFSGSFLDRAAYQRNDEAALSAFAETDRAGFYPLFLPAEAKACGLARETVFLGLLGQTPRFGAGLDLAALEPLKARDD